MHPFSGSPNGLSVFSSTVPACGTLPPKTDPLPYTNSLEIFKNEPFLSSVPLLSDHAVIVEVMGFALSL